MCSFFVSLAALVGREIIHILSGGPVWVWCFWTAAPHAPVSVPFSVNENFSFLPLLLLLKIMRPAEPCLSTLLQLAEWDVKSERVRASSNLPVE